MKYKNNSGFKQIAVINGKKEIVPNGVVIEAADHFMHPGFDRVDDNTELTFKKLVPKFVKDDKVNNLETKIEKIQSESKSANETIEILVKQECDKQFVVVFKRLEILKQAVQAIELEVERALYGEEEDDSKSR